MKIKPKPLAIIILSSFSLVVITNSGATEPTSVLGIVFWLSFGVFAFGCIHLSKNEEYYKQFIKDE